MKGVLMRGRLTSAIVLVCLCLSLSIAAYAEEDYELNVFGGGSWYTKKPYEIAFPQSAAPLSGEFRLDRAVRAGFRFGVYTRGHWSEEFLYSYEPNKAHILRLSAPSNSTSLPIQVHNYGVTALYYLSEDEHHSVRPFLSIGVGGTLYRLTNEAEAFARDPLRANLPGIKNSNELALHYGVGVKTRVSNWLGFRGDIRGFLTKAPSFGLPTESNDPNATVLPVNGALHNAEATAGLVFYFFNKR
jgi:opacity protein-like surface antigen